MINEPSGWSADCDLWSCNATHEQDDRVDDLTDYVDTLRQHGWICLGEFDTFHSLDCLLINRADSRTRKHMGDLIMIHARSRHNGERCCPDHGKHQSDGGHDWSCPERRAIAYAARQATS